MKNKQLIERTGIPSSTIYRWEKSKKGTWRNNLYILFRDNPIAANALINISETTVEGGSNEEHY